MIVLSRTAIHEASAKGNDLVISFVCIDKVTFAAVDRVVTFACIQMKIMGHLHQRRRLPCPMDWIPLADANNDLIMFAFGKIDNIVLRTQNNASCFWS